ncbi:uncharacterized protein LOC111863895 isoform X2 [Cryptotermes secundus]|uniref:uncharacterized protein LOC111863895 isoform X2 n=1 Tax=Cryptotermes secundus TaxID=105785 RepID=UPI000CD7C3B0|nr:uncharacterized protein LOC111863895 isoform X2 [Cryptotermes secundus]
MERRKICIFCNLDEENELLYGKIYNLDNDIVTHYYCLLLSSNMEQNGGDNDGILGFLREDILKEYRRGRRLTCWYCKRSGATLGCCASRCKKVFHLPCGRRSGSLHQFFGQFKSFCSVHRPVQKIDPRVLMEVKSREATCAICYDSIQPTSCPSTLWAPCCRINAWFHRDCVQKLAISAGYFFKCPLCNNKSTFQKAMLDFGIYIPEQDASWELVPNAFQELLHRHNRCDAKQCLCPKGRVHEMTGTRWELVLCKYCGSQGIHIGCGLLKWVNPEWVCDECNTMLEQAQRQDDTDSEEETAPSPSSFNQPAPKRKRRYYRGFGGPRRSRCRNDRAIASSSDPLPSSSQNLETPDSQSVTCDPESPPSPFAVIEISDDDDVVEILDENEPPSKRSTQDNSGMVLSSDGVAIPVVKVTSIPAASDGQNICVVGGLNVAVADHLSNVQRAGIQQVTQTHSVSAVSQLPTSNTGHVSRSGTNFSGSSVDKRSNKPLSSSSAGCYSSQSYGSASASGLATAGGSMLESYLIEGGSKRQPYTSQVSSVVQDTDAEPLVGTASGLANSRQAQNPVCNSSIQHPAAGTAYCSAAVPSSRSLHNRPYRARSNRQQNSTSASTGIPSQRESRHTVDRVMSRSRVLNNNLQFRVTGPDTLQVVFFNRYIVTVGLQLPHSSRRRQKCTKGSVSIVPQSETAATSDRFLR